MTWREQSKALFFMEKRTIKEISTMIGKSEKSIGKYFKTLPEYEKEKQQRKKQNKQKRKEYQRQWDRENRKNRYNKINGESLKREHDLAAVILSRERYR